MENLYLSKTQLKKAGEEIYTPHPTPRLDPPLTISYKSHQKSLANFSHLTICSFLLKGKVKRGVTMANAPPPLNTLLGRCH